MEEKKLQELKKILAERGLKNKDVAALSLVVISGRQVKTTQALNQ